MSVVATTLPDAQSARRTIWPRQIVFLVVCGMIGLLSLILKPNVSLKLGVAAAIMAYLGISIYKLYVLYEAARYGTPHYDPLEGDATTLPLYTILVPLYHEAVAIPGLLGALTDLEYPAEKLEVLLLLEEADNETIDACQQLGLPGHVRPLIVPEGRPKTKPRACNEGLRQANGEYLVIYDAEDRPEADQLRKALAAFAASGPEVICQQAKLGYYNQRQNVLTRLFTLDYANWFDGILPGLTKLRAPIPLGGTSNHFRIEPLRAVGGWDPYNVAEDADLGIRLARLGYQTAIFDSATWEEATSRIRSWIRQRSRWVKGYMQTFLVHTRQPVRLARRLGFMNTISFLVLVGGTAFASLLNPFFWLLGVVYLFTKSTAIEALFFTPIYYIGLLCLLVGNFIFVYMNVFTAVRWGYAGLAKWALLTPFYWVLHSIASYMALYELIVRPHFWQKTTHGLSPASVLTGTEVLALTAQSSNARTNTPGDGAP